MRVVLQNVSRWRLSHDKQIADRVVIDDDSGTVMTQRLRPLCESVAYIQHSACRDEEVKDTVAITLLSYTCRVVTVLRERIPCRISSDTRVNAGIDSLRTLFDGVNVSKPEMERETKERKTKKREESPRVRFKFSQRDYDVGVFEDERPELPRVVSWEYTNRASRTQRNPHDLVCVWDTSSFSRPLFLVSLINNAFEEQIAEISRIRYRVGVKYVVFERSNNS